MKKKEWERSREKDGTEEKAEEFFCEKQGVEVKICTLSKRSLRKKTSHKSYAIRGLMSRCSRRAPPSGG